MFKTRTFLKFYFIFADNLPPRPIDRQGWLRQGLRGDGTCNEQVLRRQSDNVIKLDFFVTDAPASSESPMQASSAKYYSRESLLRGKAKYCWTPWTNQLRSAAFCTENIINLCHKMSCITKKICTQPSPSVSVNCLWLWAKGLETNLLRREFRLATT